MIYWELHATQFSVGLNALTYVIFNELINVKAKVACLPNELVINENCASKIYRNF